MALFRRRPKVERDSYPLTLDGWIQQLSYMGNLYNLSPAQTLQGTEVQIAPNFAGFVEGAYKSNGVVFACMLVRMLLFSEARFAFREIIDGRPGDLFGGSDGRNPGNRDLGALAHPWPNGTTGDLLTSAITDADLAGSWFGIREGSRIRRLRPDWVTIVLTPNAYDYRAETAGYLYHPGGPNSGIDPVPLLVEQVAQFSPIPDPLAPWRGMSWLSPVIDEIVADASFTAHKKALMKNGATPNMALVGLPQTKEQFDRWVELFKEKHEGPENAGKAMFLSGAVDVKVVGADLKSLDFKQVQGAGETRIAAAAGVPPVIVGLSEGLQAATYSNYSQARRRFADGTMRPLWRNMAGSLAKLVNVPNSAELWYDDRDIAFLREDEKDAAEIVSTKATSIRTLTDGGYDPATVVDAVEAGDLRRLKHTGLVPVQLQEPGAVDTVSSNGNGKVPPELMPMGAD